MPQPKRIALPRFLLLVLTLFTLSVIWPGTGSAAPWDDLLKKAEDLASDMVKDVLDDDDDEESDDDQEAAKETEPTVESPSPDWQAEQTAPPPAPTSTPPPAAPTASTTGPASATTPATASAGRELWTAPYFLLRLKFRPGDVTEDEFLALTESQVMADQQVYKQADELEKVKGYYNQTGNKAYQQKLVYPKKALADAMKGAVFARDEVEGRDPRFVARDLVSKYRDRVEKLAAALPNSYTVEYSNFAVEYKYDHDLGGLYFDRNWWSPCDVDAIEGCLSSGRGSHFFITGGNRSRNNGYKDRRSEFEGDFILNPLGGVHDLENPFGLPNSLLRVYAPRAHELFSLPTHTLVSVDRRLEMLTLKMDSRTADEISKVRQEPGADNKRQVRTVLHFTVNELLGNVKFPTFKVSLDRLEIFSPENQLLLSDKGSGFRLGTEILAGENAKQQAVEEQIAAEQSKYDIVGVKLGMPLAAADKIVREHMSPTAEYRFERRMDIPGIDPQQSGASQRNPFGRSVVFIRLESTPPAKFLARDPVPMAVQIVRTSPWQVDLTENDQRKRQQYWDAVASQEVITLSVEKGADGEDEVVGIYRYLKLSNPNLSAISDSLRAKYGKPAREQGYSAVWGNSKCPSSGKRLSADKHIRMDDGTLVNWGERRAGVTMAGMKAKLAWSSVRHIYLTDSRWKNLPDESAYGHCGPIVSANWNTRELTISLSDFKSYFARFEDLFVSDKEAAAVKL
jgi:hypothetical protein